MSGVRQLSALASWELRTVARSRLMTAAAVAFALMCVGVSVLGLRSLRGLGVSGVGPASAALLNLGVLFPPLLALVLGAAGLSGARERGSLAMVAAQPVSRAKIVVGTFLGLVVALWTILALGFGLAALVIAGAARAADLPSLGGMALGIVAASTAALAIGMTLASMSSGRLQSLLGAVGVWLLLALGMDLALAGLGPALGLGPGGLLVAVLLNPLEGARILALLIAGGGSWGLGTFGGYLAERFGTGGAAGILGLSLVFWTTAPVAAAAVVLRRRSI